MTEARPASCPTLQAARRYGISGDHAYLISDYVAAICGRRCGWPAGHSWHVWAITKAQQDAGPSAVVSFIAALTVHYRGAAA